MLKHISEWKQNFSSKNFTEVIRHKVFCDKELVAIAWISTTLRKTRKNIYTPMPSVVYVLLVSSSGCSLWRNITWRWGVFLFDIWKEDLINHPPFFRPWLPSESSYLRCLFCAEPSTPIVVLVGRSGNLRTSNCLNIMRSKSVFCIEYFFTPKTFIYPVAPAEVLSRHQRPALDVFCTVWRHSLSAATDRKPWRPWGLEVAGQDCRLPRCL